MLCLGLDPKSDLTQLSLILAESVSSSVPRVCHPVQDTTYTSGQANGVAVQDTALTSGQANGVASRPRLLAAMLSSMGGSGQPPVATPTLTMVLTGCDAMLQLIGSEEEAIAGSLIQSGDSHVIRFAMHT